MIKTAGVQGIGLQILLDLHHNSRLMAEVLSLNWLLQLVLVLGIHQVEIKLRVEHIFDVRLLRSGVFSESVDVFLLQQLLLVKVLDCLLVLFLEVDEGRNVQHFFVSPGAKQTSAPCRSRRPA